VIEDRIGSIWVGVPMLLIAILLGWCVIALGMADLWADGAPELAISWRSDHTNALEQAADAAFDNGNIVRAEWLARRGIAAYPLDGRNYRVLASVADARDDKPSALHLLAIALARSPRDLRSHMKLAEYALKAGDIDGALRQLDPILRIEPEEEAELFPRMARLTEAPMTSAAFVRVLSQRPPWRGRFLQTLAASERDPAAVARLYRALRTTNPQSLSESEVGYWVTRQINDHDWASARAAWVSSLATAQRRALGNVFDGSFAFPASGSGFGWRMPPVPGVDVKIVASPASAAGNALTIDFAGMSVTSTGVQQLLALTPGTYVLRGNAQASALATGRGLQWTLVCADGPQLTLGTSPLLIGTQHWTDFEVGFEVPPARCGGQWLRLQLGAPDRISGRAAYSGLRVDRQSATAEATAASATQDTPPPGAEGDRGSRGDQGPSLWALFMDGTAAPCAAIVCRNDDDEIGLP
jgi:tetratricopeptide (TPR) repeat protein